ncbi:MAG TPA: hypothetical protein VGP82_08665, partial [Ktedonobacterales bacterium]|nr:hypothetical protein [Ktedonobacterales bacterium]
VLGQAITSLIGGVLLVTAGIRLIVLFRQVPSANWRRWVAFIPFIMSVPEFVLALIAGLAYHSVALTQAQLAGLDFAGLLAWQHRVNDATSGFTLLSNILTVLTVVVLGGIVLYIVLTPPKDEE